MKIYVDDKQELHLEFDDDKLYIFIKGDIDENNKIINQKTLGLSKNDEFYWFDKYEKGHMFTSSLNPTHYLNEIELGVAVIVNELSNDFTINLNEHPPQTIIITKSETNWKVYPWTP